MKNDLNDRQPQWKMNSIKTNLKNNLMEDKIN